MNNKRYRLCVIEKTQNLEYRVEHELFDIDEEYSTLKEAKENYSIFKDSNGSNYQLVGIFDNVKDKFVELSVLSNNNDWKKIK